MITGSIVALVTPMSANGDIDWEALDKLVDWHIEQGTKAIVAVGTTGESATLSVPEHCQVITHCVKKVAGRVPVIAGTGANATREAIELTEAAAEAGVDACLVVAPYYNKPTQRGLYEHHRAIAEAVAVDQILYNVPGRTAVDMSNEIALELAEIPNIVGLKDATGDVPRGIELIQRCGGKMAVYSGDDATALALMLGGAKGNISVTANVAPGLMSQMCEYALDGDADRAKAIETQLAELNEALFLEVNPIPAKWALHALGKMDTGIRLPLLPLDERYRADVERAVAALSE